MRRLRGVFLIAPALLGCGSRQSGGGAAPEPAAARAVSVAPAPVPVTSESAEAEADCGCALEKSLAALERARQRALDRAAKLGVALGAPDGVAQVPAVEEIVPQLPCWPNGANAWAVTLAEATLCPVTDEDSNLSGSGWQVVFEFHLSHFTAGTCQGSHQEMSWHVETEDWRGDQRFSRRGELCSVVGHPFYPRALEPAFFDFDADGDPEIWIGISVKYEGDTTQLYTLKSSNIEKYPVVRHEFGSMEDVTGDGRPDFLWSEALAGVIDCGDNPYDVHTPGFLAHSQPDGTFSIDSAEARKHARDWCPRPPAQLPGTLEVVCARLWGADTASLVQRIQTERTPYDCSASGSQQPNGTTEYHAMLAAAKYEPPFRLSR
jgi:hypothetical protein